MKTKLLSACSGKAWEQAANGCVFSDLRSLPGRVGNYPEPTASPLTPTFILSMEASNLSCCTVLLACAMLLVLAVLLDIFGDSSSLKSEENF